MNRTKNLLESLPSWIESHKYINDIVIVDWSSSTPLFENKIIKEYLNNKKITLLRVKDQEFYSLAKSNNLAFKYAKNDIVLKIDTDYQQINVNWMNNIAIKNNQLKIDNKKYFIHGHWAFSKLVCGFLLINKEDFLFYNEQMEGWGYEDEDLYKRVSDSGIKPIIFFNINDYIKHLDHSEEDRVVNYKQKNKKESHIENFNISSKKQPFKLSEFENISENNGYKILKEINKH